MTSKQIENPYCVTRSKRSMTPWLVSYRYLIADNLKFKHVCSAFDRKTAEKVAKLLNKDMEQNSAAI